MNPLLSQKRKEVAELCVRSGARRLDAFGSVTLTPSNLTNPYFRRRVTAERQEVYAS